MTPWREDVFDREVLRTEKNVTHIRLPVEAEENDPLGRQPGDPLCPEIGKNRAWLEEFKESYIHDPLGGARAWAAMYQCSPRVLQGNLVLREWWRYYTPRRTSSERPVFFGRTGAGGSSPKQNTLLGNGLDDWNKEADTNNGSRRYCPEPVEYDYQVISVDAAFKGNETSDYVAIQVWGRYGRDYYLRYSLNRHLDFPETLEAIRSISALFPEAGLVLIEEAANGAAVIQTLQRELFVLSVKPKGGKIARVNAVSSAIESGHVFVPDSAKAPWVDEYLEQFSTFPNAKHDDMVDSTSQALSFLISGMAGSAAEIREQFEEGPTAEEQAFDVYG